jgi:hypothetical protein
MILSLLISSGLLTTSKAADKSSDDIAAHFPSSQIAAILDCISKQAVSVPQFVEKKDSEGCMQVFILPTILQQVVFLYKWYTDSSYP